MDNRIIHWLICAFSKQLRKSYLNFVISFMKMCLIRLSDLGGTCFDLVAAL